jgi:hypothetical protein
MEKSTDERTWCPSSPPDRPESVVLGVHDGSTVTYLAMPIPAREALEMVPPGVEPRDVIRFASFCDQACRHRVGTDCGLVTKVAVAAPVADDPSLPRCHLRPRCQWWRQSGIEACRRCSLIQTAVYEPDEQLRRIGDPEVAPDGLLPT